MDVAATTSGATKVSSAASGSAALTSDFQTFLKLMTTQLEFQDPMNPVDSTEYLSQLASFSAVEQQTQTNKLLTGLQSSVAMLGMAQVATWVGHEARAVMPALVSGGEAVPIVPEIATGADRAVLVVRNSAGQLVSRVDLPVNSQGFDWQPKDIAGQPLPNGLYDLVVENSVDGEALETTGVEVYGRIDEVQSLNGEMILVMQGGRKVASSAVTALRDGL